MPSSGLTNAAIAAIVRGEVAVGVRVRARVPGDLAMTRRLVLGPPQVVAVERRERAVERQQLEPVSPQLELANDLGAQQRDDVRAHREAKPGEHFLGDRRAAHHRPALEHEHLQPRPRQIRRAHEAVVSRADDDDVPLARHGATGYRLPAS